jgi:hypothetical protein
MTTVATPEAHADAPIGTARVTGLLYLGLALTGLLGFLTIRPRIFDPDDSAARSRTWSSTSGWPGPVSRSSSASSSPRRWSRSGSTGCSAPSTPCRPARSPPSGS